MVPALLACRAAPAQPFVPAAARAVAWWALEPGPLCGAGEDGKKTAGEPGRAALESAMRIAISGGLVKGPADVEALKAMLAASIIASTPHTVCVLDLAEKGRAGGGA